MATQLKDEVLDYYVAELRNRLKSHLKKIMLFGSRARGDYDDDSDYDVLVVVDELTSIIWDIIDDVAGDVLMKFDHVVCGFPILESSFGPGGTDALVANVRHEGILL